MTDRSDQILSQLNIYDYVHSRIVYCIHVNLPCSVSSRLFSTPSRFLASFLSSLFSDQFNLKHQSVKFIIWRVYGVRVSNFYVLSMSWSFTWLNKKKGEEDKMTTPRHGSLSMTQKSIGQTQDNEGVS